MANDWDYAKAAKWIAEHGGTQKAFEIVKNHYLKEGFQRGAASKNPVIAAVCASCIAIGALGKTAYAKIMERKALKLQAAEMEQRSAKEAETTIMTVSQA